MKTSLLIFGAFCIAYNLDNFLHEFGHGVAVWISGGRVSSMILNPFSWSWISYLSNPNPLFTAWGGVLFGVLFAIVLAAAALLIRSPYMAPLYLLAGCAMASNGIYFSVAAFADIGDAGALLSLGVPRLTLVAIGLLLLVISCLWVSAIQPLLGIPSDTSFHRRLLTMHMGVTPYLIAMAVYVLVFEKTNPVATLAFPGVGVLAVTAIAVSGHLLRNVATHMPRLAYLEPTWTSAILLLSVGIAIILGELIYFGVESNPWL